MEQDTSPTACVIGTCLRLLLQLHRVHVCKGVHMVLLGVHVGHLLAHRVVLVVDVRDAEHWPCLAASRVGTPFSVHAHLLNSATP